LVYYFITHRAAARARNIKIWVCFVYMEYIADTFFNAADDDTKKEVDKDTEYITRYNNKLNTLKDEFKVLNTFYSTASEQHQQIIDIGELIVRLKRKIDNLLILCPMPPPTNTEFSHIDKIRLLKDFNMNLLDVNILSDDITNTFLQKANETQNTFTELSYKRDKLMQQIRVHHKITKQLHETQINNKYKCTICLTNEVNYCLQPCGHTLCTDCYGKLAKNTKCYACNTIINSKQKLFFLGNDDIVDDAIGDINSDMSLNIPLFRHNIASHASIYNPTLATPAAMMGALANVRYPARRRVGASALRAYKNNFVIIFITITRR
jgi:hypothetical protein